MVHFCSWRNAVHRHEEHLARLNDPEEHLQIVEDVGKNLLLRNSEVDILVVGVGALMDDSIHVEIEIVEFRNLKNDTQSKKGSNASFLFFFFVYMVTGKEKQPQRSLEVQEVKS